MYKVSTIIYKFLHYIIMKVFLHVVAYILVIVIQLESICAKSVREGESKFRDDNEVKLYPIKRKSPNYEQSYYVIAHEEQPDVEYSDTLSNLESVNAERYRRVDDQLSNNLLTNNLQSVNDYKMKPSFSKKQIDLRRQAMQNGLIRRADRLNKRDMESLPLQSDDSYGMVYRKGRLVGILEPFPTAYELSPLSNVREGIEEIHPLPMAGNRLAPLDPRYATNRFISDKQANGDWNMKAEGSPEPIKYADEKAPVNLNNYKRDSKADSINSYKRDSTRNAYSTDRESDSNVKLKTNDQISKINNGVSKEEKSNLVMPNSQYNRDSELQYSASPELSESKTTNDVKRSISGITNEKISELKLALNRIQNPDPSDRVEEIEEDLRNILNDMGLIDSDRTSDSLKSKRSLSNSQESAVNKKQVDKEDENLEQGVNRIEIVKTSHELPKSEREKREETKESQSDTAKSSKDSDQETSNNDNLESNEDDNSDLKADNNANSELDSEKQNKEAETADDNSENSEKKRGASKINVADYQSEGASYIRSKRQESSTSSNDIMKGLEKSGDLTVSGNKSPLASSENGPDAAEKHSSSSSSSTTPGPRSPNPELSDAKYESEIERNLQAKIDAIKEEVKREIAALQLKNSVGEKETQENQRKKRDAPMTLLDEETNALNPQEHPGEVLVPLIRRRRNLENPVSSKRSKRSLPDYSNLRNMDSGDYLELNENKKREQRDTLDYQTDAQENKYLPQNVQISNENVGNSNKEKRNSGAIQQDNLIEVDAVNSKVDNQENAYSQENVAKVSERNTADSSNSNVATLNNDNSAKEVNVMNKHEENSNSVVDKTKDNTNSESKSFGTPETDVQIQKKTANNDNSKLLENQPEEIHDNIKKRVAEKIPTKELVESLANKQFNAELKKLNSDSEKDDQMLEKGKEKKPGSGLKNTQIKQEKRSADVSKNEKSEMKNSASVDDLEKQEKSKRAIQNLSVAPTNSENKEASGQKVLEDSRRRRRQLDEDQNQNKRLIMFKRKKRANALLPDGNVAYVAYRPEDEDVDDEGDEFDDDSFDDRTASMQKREINVNNENYDSLQEYDSPDGYYNYQPDQRKSSLARRYVSRINSDLYENPSPGYAGNYLYHPDAYIRRKRQNNFNQLVALHGGGQMRHHIAAMKERNERFAKQNYKRNHDTKEEAQNIADLSDTDLFGALPQSYEGELSRFKRIKRAAEDVTPKQ